LYFTYSDLYRHFDVLIGVFQFCQFDIRFGKNAK
jgi:hypothetical protein